MHLVYDHSQQLSPKRTLLCSREHALRVADQICAATCAPVCVVRTGHPLQPYRVAHAPGVGDTVTVEVRQ